MLGIIQEQHPDRCRLFMQWKRMDWPILTDSYNLLGVAAVPITLFVDEAGIIRAVNPRESDLEAFLERPSQDPASPAAAPEAASSRLQRPAAPDAGLTRADRLALWATGKDLEAAIVAYRKRIEQQPGDGPAHFRLGVALRKRHDSEERRDGDFQQAVRNWERALEIDPNQYIWRRRIQQYGPRLGKPYPFYDWVTEARREIAERGETPTPLLVEPSGAEFAAPSQDFDSDSAHSQPDPEGRIYRDEEGFVVAETAVVPQAVATGGAVRVHLSFRPNPAIQSHWNNEAEDMQVWINPPDGWSVDRRLLSLPRPPEAVSLETRRLEFEARAPEDFSGKADIPFYALYYVCEGVNGTCLFRRRDLTVTILKK